MKWMFTIVSVAVFVFAVVVLFENSSLRRRVYELECARQRVCDDKYRVLSFPPSYLDQQVLNSIIGTISLAYSNEQTLALQNYAKIIDKLAKPQCSNDWSSIERAFHDELNDSFLRSSTLAEFENARQLECFLHVNYDLAMYFGCRSIAQREFEVLPVYETLSCSALKAYREKYMGLGRKDLSVVVDEYLVRLIDHIESPEGFTRIGARQRVILNTEIANTMRPGTGVSHESAMKIGRAIAQELVNCGYTPKWLDEEFPLQPETEK